VPSRSLVPALRRRVMGNSLGGHLHTVYRTEGELVSVGGCLLAGDGCHQSMLIVPRQYGRAASFDSTRAAQLVRLSVAKKWPAFPGGWPVRRGIVAVGQVGAARVGLATLGKWGRWRMVGGRSGRGHGASVRA
jgi:hypothetical protein